MTLPDASPVVDLIEAFRRSQTMFAAVKLGVFDRLHKGSAAAAELAAELEANADALERLLDACVGLRLLRKQDGRYSNTGVADTYLCRTSPYTLTGYIHYSRRVLYPMWGHLDDAVREGSHRWPQTFGLEGQIFDQFFQTEESMKTFLLGMHGFGMLSSPKVVDAFDLSGFRKLVDLGGATGHLAIAACERYPGLRAAVFDLPRVIAVAREIVGKSAAQDRIELIPGDFFTDELPEGDLFAVGRILHDWAEDKIATLVKSICEKLPAGGGLLIAERLLDPDKSGPAAAHMQSLNMLVCTEGKERTLEEYRALLSAAGFTRVEGRPTGAPLDAVLAVK